MKKLIAVMFMFSSVAFAQSDERVESLCKDKGTMTETCQQVISEELDNAYRIGEENAHLSREEKLQKQTEYLVSGEMQSLCMVAPDRKKCELYRGYLIEEFNSGIGLY